MVNSRSIRSWTYEHQDVHRSIPFSLRLIYCIAVSASMVVAQSNGITTNPAASPTITMLPTTIESVSTKTPISESNATTPCYSNITELAGLTLAKDPFIDEIYILCPDTVYELGDGTAAKIGFDPLIVKGNSIFQCGNDGKSSNGCVLSGGSFQVATFSDFDDEYIAGVVFQGITFEAGSFAAAFLIAPGETTFIDCIFKNHRNSGVVIGGLDLEFLRRRDVVAISSEGESRLETYYNALKSAQELHDVTRDLQTSVDELRQLIVFENCLFQNNSHGPDGEMIEDGIITGLAVTDIALKSCIFQNNSYPQPKRGVNTYAISVQTGQLAITDTCFINNDFIGEGIVIASNASFFNASNIYGTSNDDNDVTCEFAITGEGCVPFSSVRCMADIFNGSTEVTTTTEPTLAPVRAPTPTMSVTSDSLRRSYEPYTCMVLMLLLAFTSM